MDIRPLVSRGFDLWGTYEECEDNSDIYKYNIWDGTGILDISSDWVHEGEGVESPLAMKQGTNGLLVEDSEPGDVVLFYSDGFVEFDINNYDFLSFWINIRKWQLQTDITVRLFSTFDNNGTILNISEYIMEDDLNNWSRVIIPLQRFEITQDSLQPGFPRNVNQLEFIIEGESDFWMDDISLVVGELITIPVCGPEMKTHKECVTTVPFPRPINI